MKAKSNVSKKKAKQGAPTLYTEKLAEKICEKLANTEWGVHRVAKEFGITATSIFKWLNNYPEFADKYARAREMQAEFMAQSILDIADDSRSDTIITKKGDIPNTEWINRSKLRVDSRKWLMSKLAPRKYGDKVEHSGTLDLNHTVTGMEIK